jgi:hypothetical protein
MIRMLQFTRNNRLLAAFVALLLSVSTVGTSLSAAAGGPEHAPLAAVAVLPGGTRPQRDRRYWAARSIRRRLRRRLRERRLWLTHRGAEPRSRLPIRESYARGPPR